MYALPLGVTRRGAYLFGASKFFLSAHNVNRNRAWPKGERLCLAWSTARLAPRRDRDRANDADDHMDSPSRSASWTAPRTGIN